jgi:hypothetical protein
MLRLAIDIGGLDRQGEVIDCLVPFRRFDAPELVRHIGTSVLIYEPSGATSLFVGSAVLGAILPQESDSQLAARLTEVRSFAVPVERPAYGRTETVPWITLPAALFDTILAAGERGGGLDEAAMPFVHAGEDLPAAPNLATYGALSRAVLRNYGHACAMTGESSSGRAGKLGEPALVPIRPRPQGGPVHVTNCIVLAPAAGEALSQGHIAVTDDFRLVADLSRIDPELLAQINPDGRLRVPEDETLRPARTHLAWHRQWALEADDA